MLSRSFGVKKRPACQVEREILKLNQTVILHFEFPSFQTQTWLSSLTLQLIFLQKKVPPQNLDRRQRHRTNFRQNVKPTVISYLCSFWVSWWKPTCTSSSWSSRPPSRKYPCRCWTCSSSLWSPSWGCCSHPRHWNWTTTRTGTEDPLAARAAGVRNWLAQKVEAEWTFFERGLSIAAFVSILIGLEAVWRRVSGAVWGRRRTRRLWWSVNGLIVALLWYLLSWLSPSASEHGWKVNWCQVRRRWCG